MNIILRNGELYVPFYRSLNTSDLWETLSREIWDSWSPFTPGDRLLPHTDLHEEKGQLVMKTKLPGIEKGDLDISLEGKTLTIKAERKDGPKKNAARHGRERLHGEYSYSITLPYQVKEDQVAAKFDKGVLELRLPRAEEPKARKIEIKAQLPGGESKKPELKPGQQKS
jgi:HSP20 family protein